jgi:hypothetical protein
MFNCILRMIKPKIINAQADIFLFSTLIYPLYLLLELMFVLSDLPLPE